MKKYLLSMLAVFCIVFALGSTTVSERHFDYDEAWQIASGNWYSYEVNKDKSFVWKSYEGSV